MNLYHILIITVLTALSGFLGSSKTCPLNTVAEGFAYYLYVLLYSIAHV